MSSTNTPPSELDDFEPGRPVRVVFRVLLVMAVVHAALIAVWVAPTNAIRDAIGPARLAGYIQPMFDQGWSVFAPIPKEATTLMEFRATIVTGKGSSHTSEWIAPTAAEVGSVRLNPFPSRMSIATMRIGTTIATAWNKMSDAQHQVARRSDNDPTGDSLSRDLLKASPDNSAITNQYMQGNRAAVIYGSLLTQAHWGGDVTYVQFRTARVLVRGHGLPGSSTYQLPWVESGWRVAVRTKPAAVDAFRSYAESAGMIP